MLIMLVRWWSCWWWWCAGWLTQGWLGEQAMGVSPVSPVLLSQSQFYILHHQHHQHHQHQHSYQKYFIVLLTDGMNRPRLSWKWSKVFSNIVKLTIVTNNHWWPRSDADTNSWCPWQCCQCWTDPDWDQRWWMTRDTRVVRVGYDLCSSSSDCSDMIEQESACVTNIQCCDENSWIVNFHEWSFFTVKSP